MRKNCFECRGCRIHRYVAATYRQPEILTSKNKAASDKVLIKHEKKTEAFKSLECVRPTAKNFFMIKQRCITVGKIAK
jgi:hypothetical protein